MNKIVIKKYEKLEACWKVNDKEWCWRYDPREDIFIPMRVKKRPDETLHIKWTLKFDE